MRKDHTKDYQPEPEPPTAHKIKARIQQGYEDKGCQTNSDHNPQDPKDRNHFLFPPFLDLKGRVDHFLEAMPRFASAFSIRFFSSACDNFISCREVCWHIRARRILG